MRCPICGFEDSKVVDSRSSKDASVIRRRRQCLSCDKRFTTYERVEELETYVIKKDGSREPFDRRKLRNGMEKALIKRKVSLDRVDAFLDELEQSFQEQNQREIPVQELGIKVLGWLRETDAVAYIRFASVYRSFNDVSEFKQELDKLADSGIGKPEDRS